MLHGHHDALSRALSNVLLNAVEACGASGAIARARAPHRPRGGREIVIAIRDTGVGISPDRIDAIFDPYVTDKTGGTGLGLAIVKQTVLAHGGAVEAESTRGSGTEIRLIFPAGTDTQRRNDGHFARGCSGRYARHGVRRQRRARAREGVGAPDREPFQACRRSRRRPRTRIERMERAIDSIAIEVERISENQRFMTKLLVGRGADARGAGIAASRRGRNHAENASVNEDVLVVAIVFGRSRSCSFRSCARGHGASTAAARRRPPPRRRAPRASSASSARSRASRSRSSGFPKAQRFVDEGARRPRREREASAGAALTSTAMLTAILSFGLRLRSPVSMPSVLIVDDEPNIRRMVGALLTSEGFEVRDAADGAARPGARRRVRARRSCCST